MTHDLVPEANFISAKSEASESPVNLTELRPFKYPRLSSEQNTRATMRPTSPVSADGDGLGTIPMTVPKVREKGSVIAAEESESVAASPPSPATGKGRHHDKPFVMVKESYGDAGDYPNPRRRSFQPSPGSQERLTEQLVSLMPFQIPLFCNFTTDIS